MFLIRLSRNILPHNEKHGKKSDKETQSPVLKVFKEMIQRENNDPEKANLLKEKQENRKRRQYSGTRSKSERVNRSGDSSSSEKNRRNVHLKKIISSEYTCIACLGVMFLLTVLIAFVVLFKTVPIEAKAKGGHAKVATKKPREFGSDVLKRKIDQIQRGKDEMTRSERRRIGADGDVSRRPSESVRSDSELSSVLDAEKLNDGLSSERLRNFYKKLIQTDAQIRSLKKSVNEYTQTNYDEAKFKYPDRSKRSLRLRAPKSLLRYDIKKEAKTPILTENNLAEIRQFNLFYPPLSAVNYTNKKNKKCKRFLNGTEVPTGFVIEKKQILVQYKPHDNRKVPKCSHAPKDSKSHEKQLKHPFYKNTQRLDELLDQFLDKHLPEIMEDPFGVDVLFKQNKDVKTQKTNVKIENEKVTKNGFFVTKKPVAGKVKNKEKNDKHQSTDKLFKFDHNRFVSKPMNILGRTPSLLERVPHIRKLLQVDEEDEEGLGYEDFKEVLADDTEAHDETDKSQDRKKRMDDDREQDFKIPNNPYKYNPPGVHNPNWKGPMPLYPDELSSMIKQAAIENVENFNKIHIPSNDKDSSETDSLETYLNDMEYIENYSDNKFQKLAKMAQAYSDYGVLEGKKESSSNEKVMDGKNAERRVKLSINKGNTIQKQQQQQQQAMDKMETTTKKPDPNEYPDSSIVFTFAKNGRRSLKSVEDDPDKTIENKDRTTNNESQLLTNSESGNFKENITANYTSNTNAGSAENTQNNNIISAILNLNEPRERNGNSSEMAALSDFFMMMSNWFSVMAGFETSSETNDPKSNIIKLITKSDTFSTTPKRNESIEFPMYDSDMIENIGHRSRVLMSLEENNDKSTDMADVTEISTILMKVKDEDLTKDVSTSPDTLSTTETVTANASPSKLKDKEFSLTKSERSKDNKTLVKRNVPEDSNLIFWNDIYDDEYGVKMDPIDSINFMRKSGNWIQDKVKNFANNFRGKDKMNMNNYGTFKRRVLHPSLIYKKYSKRDADTEEKGGFAALTAKMKEVCKEAAKAVQQTKNVQVRQDDKEDSMTTSLMQQLVRLMTDLIDFQVQQKTCVKLPPDLQEFLVWLTSPNDENIDFRNQKTSYHESNSFVLDLVTTPSSEKEEIHADSRSECLGTLHAVQDLMQQYDEMTDEDKSKMTGIRDYLENQLQFLHKQLATFDGYKVSTMFEDLNPSYRFRRDLLAKGQNHRKKLNRFRSRRNRRNRFKRKFLKNFGKKHTRTTASIYDGFAMTEVNKLKNKNVKRNLKDVYYKALDDAKKSTTFKTTLKDEMEGFDHAQIVRIDN
ncbi:hypothetical protein ABMA27_011109 [Loxostege sticticalis]|uniref:Uncharacterized protein n=1 Tax=Loxostege sticticalis TaxID=481309 RepID=A0ABR3H3C1_LOXSC